MADPLFTEAEAHARILKLLASFDRNPDVLSPDEQALAMGIRQMERAGRDLGATTNNVIAGRILATAEGHLARGVSGRLAMDDWRRLAESLRDPVLSALDKIGRQR